MSAQQRRAAPARPPPARAVPVRAPPARPPVRAPPARAVRAVPPASQVRSGMLKLSDAALRRAVVAQRRAIPVRLPPARAAHVRAHVRAPARAIPVRPPPARAAPHASPTRSGIAKLSGAAPRRAVVALRSKQNTINSYNFIIFRYNKMTTRKSPRRISRSRRVPCKKNQVRDISTHRCRLKRKPGPKSRSRKVSTKRKSPKRKSRSRKASTKKSPGRKSRVLWAGWANSAPGAHARTIMLKECGQKCFLGPHKSFPICTKGTCDVNTKGVAAAYIRAKSQLGKKHPGGSRKTYEKVARNAKSRLRRAGYDI